MALAIHVRSLECTVSSSSCLYPCRSFNSSEEQLLIAGKLCNWPPLMRDRQTDRERAPFPLQFSRLLLRLEAVLKILLELFRRCCNCRLPEIHPELFRSLAVHIMRTAEPTAVGVGRRGRIFFRFLSNWQIEHHPLSYAYNR